MFFSIRLAGKATGRVHKFKTCIQILHHKCEHFLIYHLPISEIPLAFLSKQGMAHNHSCENAHLIFVLRTRLKVIKEWPIPFQCLLHCCVQMHLSPHITSGGTRGGEPPLTFLIFW